MKNTSITLFAITALALGGLSLQAQTYYDAVDFNPSTYQTDVPGASPNLYVSNVTVTPLLAVTGDGTPDWRYRNTGPGVPAWNGNSYQIRYTEGDVSGYQEITGLTPSMTYYVAVYGVYPQNTTNMGSRYGAEFSLDGGNTYSLVDNRGGSGINWVDNSTDLGVSQPTVNAGDTRFWSWIPGSGVSDASGNLDVYLRLPATLSDGTATDRFILDGFMLSTVPEPATLALAGVGAAALLFLRRRRR